MSSPPLTASCQSGNAYVVVADDGLARRCDLVGDDRVSGEVGGHYRSRLGHGTAAVAVVHHEPREDLVLLEIEPGGAVPRDDRLLLSSGPGDQRVADDVSVLALTTEILPPDTPTDEETFGTILGITLESFAGKAGAAWQAVR